MLLVLLQWTSLNYARKMPAWTKKEVNQGDDMAGIVEEVGENVTEFKKGDRVAAYHEIFAPGGSYAEYGLSWQHTCFHIPKKTSFEGKLESCKIVLCDEK